MNRSLDGWRSDGSFDVGKREKDLFRKKQIGTRRTPLLFIAWCIYNYLPMKLLEVVFFFLFLHSTTVAFVPPSNKTERSVVMSADGNIQQSETPCMGQHPFNSLPGDPSLNLVTNVDLGDKKMEIMKACSKAICQHTGKPESYIAVTITDNASVIFGGSDAPTALGNLYSIGAIAKESNGAITASVTDLLEPFGVTENRIYINFFDMARANVGWSRKTFAG